ncbi:MAG TPA: hypothetical protein VEU30_04925, partial [Thermoanaerobaculia bacterium]|nr:hypothetical protein [Thermoanaerobaculia bacterium]
IDNARFRSNLGAVIGNGSSTDALVISVNVRGADGVSAGTRTITVAPGNFTHLQFDARSMIGTRMLDIGSAEFRITAGSGAVVPYASVVDNATADAVFVAGVFPNNNLAAGVLGAASTSTGGSIFRTLLDGVSNQ